MECACSFTNTLTALVRLVGMPFTQKGTSNQELSEHKILISLFSIVCGSFIYMLFLVGGVGGLFHPSSLSVGLGGGVPPPKMAWGILVSWPGVQSSPQQWEPGVLTPEPPRNSLMCSSLPSFGFGDLMPIVIVDINFSSSSDKIPTCSRKTIPWHMLSASLLFSSTIGHLGIKPQIKPIINFSTSPHKQLDIVKNHTTRLVGFTFIVTDNVYAHSTLSGNSRILQ